MKRLLVVDDELVIRDFLRRVFEAEGYQVLTVPSASQALEKVAEKAFDLALIDLRLPDSDGLFLVRRLRPLAPEMVIVIYSGYLTPEIEKESRLAGANEALSKGLGVNQLTAQIRKFARSGAGAASLASHPILVVDDDAAIRHLLKAFFKAKGYQVAEAEDGQKALDILASTEVSVVLLDVEMPGMDGLTTLDKILQAKPQTGVVMVTGIMSDERVKAALERGAIDYVLKPFDLLYLELVVLSKISTASG